VTAVRVLVVDDHPLFRHGVRGLLASVAGIEVVGEAADGPGAVRLATEQRPDLVLMDLNLPGMSGVEATRQVRRASPSSAVLVLTMVADDDAVVAALRAGASGYLLKGVGQEDLLAAVRTVAAGGVVVGSGVARRVLAALTGAPAGPPRSVEGLTAREAEVLELMGQGLDNPRIARALGVSLKTVQNHVSRVLVKLQAHDRVDAVLRLRDGRA
jgi:DNA-binding NarL/FixJ family response regulator